MIRLFLLLNLFATSALAGPVCPTKADAISPGIHVEFRHVSPIQYTVTRDGKVIEDTIENDSWRYEVLDSVFLLRYGPFKTGVFEPTEMETAHYSIPLADLPAIEKGMEWQGHVSYTTASEPPWKSKLTVTTKPTPDLQIGNCSYEAIMVLINETHVDGAYVTDEDETYTTFLMFLPELGFGIQTGLFSDLRMEKFIPVSIRRIGDD